MNKKQNTISLFAVSFSQGFKSPQVPIATFRQGNKNFRFLLDTGSEHNVINKDALQFLEHEMIDEGDLKRTLSGVGGTEEVQNCYIKFSCTNEENGESETYCTNFLVTDLSAPFDDIMEQHGIQLHGIIGSMFLKEHNVIMDFKNLAAYSKK